MHIFSLIPTGFYSDNGFAWQCLKTTNASIQSLDILKRPNPFLKKMKRKFKKKEAGGGGEVGERKRREKETSSQADYDLKRRASRPENILTRLSVRI